MYYVPDPPLNQLSELAARCERVSPGNTFGRFAYCTLCFYFRMTDVRNSPRRIEKKKKRVWSRIIVEITQHE